MQVRRSRPRTPRAVALKLALIAVLALSGAFVASAHGRPGGTSPTAAAPAGRAAPGAPRLGLPTPPPKPTTQKQRDAAARRAARQGMTPAVTALAQAKMGVTGALAAGADTTPHFFGPFANYANSPLPTVQGGVVPIGNGLIARRFATDFAAPPGDFGRVFVTVGKKLPTGLLKAFKTFNQTDPGGSPTGSEGGVFHAYVLHPTGTPDQYTVAFDSGTLTVPAATDPAGEIVTYPMPDVAVQAGDVLAFYGQGVPVDTGTGTDIVSAPAADQPPALDSTITIGSADYPKTDPARTYSFAADVVDLSGSNDVVVGGIKKFVDTLPGLGESNKNDLGQYLPVAQPDTTTYPGSDYYEIAVVQYREKLHRDLPATLLRGYVQLSTDVVAGKKVELTNAKLDGTTAPILDADGKPVLGVDAPHDLGPIISATKDRPVRIKFRNLLPKGVDGDLFLPVDTTVMGSGMGPKMGGMAEPDPRNPMCGQSPKPAGCYTENRATLHLHGGITPWISDGTPHQWITPAGAAADYPNGVSVSNVPDMPDPGDGSQTFFYTNQQSARMMFYHDHSWGITRLNVYAGEAAGYLISDDTEKKLISDGVIPGSADTLPLILQDRTFVPSRKQLDTTDPLWDNARWGGEGNLWMPHVYMPAENPGDSSGNNAFGRWAYGPWFWPPTNTNIKNGPIPNPYYDPACDTETAGWCEPPEIPGVPNNSMGMEAFHDTPIVNGTAYPTTTVDPKAYRFKILNAANDRFWNLSLYQADATGTEVALNADQVAAAKDDPAGVFPTPDTAKSPEGPSWLQIGTDGGFLPSPVEVKPHPITWVTDPTVFNAGNVDKHALLLGPAQRADVVVDFSKYAGKDLILYNDAPAAFPARDPRYDYYTDNADLTSTGGAPTTRAGYGPNTRTVMRIHVADAQPAAAFDAQKVVAAFQHHLDADGKPDGVFEKSQKPIVVGQGAYNDALGTAFRNSAPRDGLARIHDFSLTFDTLSGKSLTIPMKNKAIQDEMGEAFEPDYGRMSGNLGLETSGAQAGAQNLILYPYVNPASEIIDGVTDAQPISTTSDGTQIWKITHNGVDTHPIHFHLFDVQLINRVGWDGIIRKPEPSELGWQDTVRVSPLEDTIVALRPILPKQPFGVPDSVRPLNPMMPLGSTEGFNSTDADGNPITPALTNKLVNFGWEYVWHCHILSHEEMDMMRPISVNVARALPDKPIVTYTRNGAVKLAWTDGTPVTDALGDTWGRPDAEVGYRIERATVAANGNPGTYTRIATAPANQTAYTDASAGSTTRYSYRVTAFNAAGDAPSTAVLAGPAGVAAPAAPTQLAATLQAGPQIGLSWRDNAGTETGFVVERAVNGSGNYVPLATPAERTGTGTVTYIDTTVKAGTSYQYRVKAVNGGGSSAYVSGASVTVPALPAAPSNLTATAARANGNNDTVTLKWTDNATNEAAFEVQRSASATFSGPTTQTAPANATQLVQTGLVRNRTYHYRVRATNPGGPSDWSNAVSVTTP